MTERSSNSRRRRRRSIVPPGCVVLLFVSILAFLGYLLVPFLASRTYGPVSKSLGGFQRFQYSALMLWYNGLITRPADPLATGEQAFVVGAGEGAASVAARLAEAGIIRDARAFRAYLAYSGLDTGVQAGEFSLSPALAPMQIAHKLQDATPTQP